LEAREVKQSQVRVCILSEYFYPDDSGGTGMILGQLCQELKHQNPSLEIIAISSNNLYRGNSTKLISKEVWHEIKIHRINTPKTNTKSSFLRIFFGLWFTLFAFIELIKTRSDFDVVLVVTNPPAAPMAALAAKFFTKKPYIYLIHDLYPDIAIALKTFKKESILAKILHLFQGIWLRSAEKIIVLGRCMKNHVVKNYFIESSDIDVFTNWSNFEHTEFAQKETNFRKIHHIEGLIGLYAGNFGKYQNFDNILTAAKILSTKDLNLTFVFVGNGSQRKYIEERIYADELTNCQVFDFVPPDGFSDLLASADFSFVTLEPGAEGLGVPSKFYNILASGRSTIAILPKDSEVALTLAEFDCGIQVDQGQPDTLANEIYKLCKNPERMKMFGENASRAFSDHFTLRSIAAKYNKLLSNEL
jgi:colanic acid biosynthesis glycosyl transferase WcaI